MAARDSALKRWVECKPLSSGDCPRIRQKIEGLVELCPEAIPFGAIHVFTFARPVAARIRSGIEPVKSVVVCSSAAGCPIAISWMTQCEGASIFVEDRYAAGLGMELRTRSQTTTSKP